jgi:hypothetical protein
MKTVIIGGVAGGASTAARLRLNEERMPPQAQTADVDDGRYAFN